MTYIAVDNDAIDKQLAECINSDKNRKAKMLFVREGAGIYTYCKKKVFLKSKSDQLIIRVGGGYMSLDEFIENFNPFQFWKPKNLREDNVD